MTHDPAALLATVRRDLTRLPKVLGALLSDLDDALWRRRQALKEWSALEIVCHLRDEESEDFGARVRVVIASGAAFAPIDPERWAVDRRYHEADPHAALVLLNERRAANLQLMATIEPKRLEHAVELPRAGRLTGLDLLAAWVTHDRLHVAQLTSTLARVGADSWSGLRTGYAGPIPYGQA